jgi:hypothetical protein
MGIEFSKIHEKKIQLPNNYKLLKILSYNVRLISSSLYRANKIGYYLAKLNNGINNDILCLQCIYDVECKNTIIEIFKNIYKNIYIIPQNMDDIGFLILSNYEIIDYKYNKFIDNIKSDNNIDQYGVICVNINIDGHLISIYNTCFPTDYKNIISNKEIRYIYFEQLQLYIKQNIKHICTTNLLTKYTPTNLNLVVGSLNISGLNMNNIHQTDEYQNIMINFNYIDIYKLLNINKNLFINERKDYIFMYLIDNDDINNDKKEHIHKIINPIKKKMNKTKDYKNIQNIIFKYYNTNFIDSSIINMDYSDHYPIELILIIRL